MSTRLPLFPLSTVLVPGLVLPLHIFEPRYRDLVADLLTLPEDEPRPFGVIAVLPGQSAEGSAHPQMYEIGCVADLREITELPDGRFDVVAVGLQRFRLQGVQPDAGTRYLTAAVDLLPEHDDLAPEELARLADRVALRFAAYRDRLRVEQSGVPTDPRVLSYLVAAAAVLTLPQRQRLLSAPSTAERLGAELEMLREEISLIDAFHALPAVDLLGVPFVRN